jgi:AraC family transcriptional regulator of adaptative response/methylated-DNA-[protein]-cysteine methyltransferase
MNLMQDFNRIAEALEYIRTHMVEQPDLNKVAKSVHVSPFHFQRMFTDWAGVSPKKFLQYLTIGYAKNILKEQQGTVFDAAYDTGLSGTGRLHDLFIRIEGMTPGEFKNGGKNLQIEYSTASGAFGHYLVASTPSGICNLLFFDQAPEETENELRSLWPNASITKRANNQHRRVQDFFNHAISGKEKIGLHVKGTSFQLKVWEALLKIPEGQLTSYSGIASGIASPSAQRAVGSAIGSNPVGFLIPCHRVIRRVGGIGEYRWGTSRKMAMIGWEAARQEAV